MVVVYFILSLMYLFCCLISLPFLLDENNTKRVFLYHCLFFISFEFLLTAVASIVKLYLIGV